LLRRLLMQSWKSYLLQALVELGMREGKEILKSKRGGTLKPLKEVRDEIVVNIQRNRIL